MNSYHVATYCECVILIIPLWTLHKICDSPEFLFSIGFQIWEGIKNFRVMTGGKSNSTQHNQYVYYVKRVGLLIICRVKIGLYGIFLSFQYAVNDLRNNSGRWLLQCTRIWPLWVNFLEHTSMHRHYSHWSLSILFLNNKFYSFFTTATRWLLQRITIDCKVVLAMVYAKPYPFGNCEPHGTAWGVHFISEFLLWPPIPKSVCSCPCMT